MEEQGAIRKATHESQIGEVLEGKLPIKQYRMVSGWMALHEDELYAAWNNAVRQMSFDKIEPLK
jgi:hypothetical protein